MGYDQTIFQGGSEEINGLRCPKYKLLLLCYSEAPLEGIYPLSEIKKTKKEELAKKLQEENRRTYEGFDEAI